MYYTWDYPISAEIQLEILEYYSENIDEILAIEGNNIEDALSDITDRIKLLH